jgi:hypothetical protein
MKKTQNYYTNYDSAYYEQNLLLVSARKDGFLVCSTPYLQVYQNINDGFGSIITYTVNKEQVIFLKKYVGGWGKVKKQSEKD